MLTKPGLDLCISGWASTYDDENGFDGGDYSVLTRPTVGLCKSRGLQIMMTMADMMIVRVRGRGFVRCN